MSGNRAGGLKAAAKIKEKYGEDHYSKIGSLGQASWAKNGRKPRGFSTMTDEEHKAASQKGGKARLGRKYARNKD